MSDTMKEYIAEAEKDLPLCINLQLVDNDKVLSFITYNNIPLFAQFDHTEIDQRYMHYFI